jgi:hypothetical protein
VKTKIKILLAIGFAIAMGYFEAATVVYIIEIINSQLPIPELNPLQHLMNIGDNLYLMELFREASTIIMLGVLAIICTGSLKIKELVNKGLYYFMLAFGTWDVFYYTFLKLIIGWPQNLMDSDLLFSIPITWLSPVLAPILVSLSMITISIIMLYKIDKKKYKPLKLINWLLILTGSTIIIFLTFMTSYTVIDNVVVPGNYAWGLFIPGLIVFGLGFFIHNI